MRLRSFGHCAAVCQWALYGPQSLEPLDSLLLAKYEPQLPPGNYFGVAPALANVCRFAWLGKGCHRRDVPKNACYWAHCGKCYVWVCPEGMDCFSKFVLVCQTIARFDLGTLWKPNLGIKTVKWSSADLNNPRLQQVQAYVDDSGNIALSQTVLACLPSNGMTTSVKTPT